MCLCPGEQGMRSARLTRLLGTHIRVTSPAAVCLSYLGAEKVRFAWFTHWSSWGTGADIPAGVSTTTNIPSYWLFPHSCMGAGIRCRCPLISTAAERETHTAFAAGQAKHRRLPSLPLLG